MSLLKNYKALYKVSKKKLMKMSGELVDREISIGDFVAEYLKVLRDDKTMSHSGSEESLAEIREISSAIRAYERARQCFGKYFYDDGGCSLPYDEEVDVKELIHKISEERSEALTEFWQAVAYESESWAASEEWTEAEKEAEEEEEDDKVQEDRA